MMIYFIMYDDIIIDLPLYLFNYAVFCAYEEKLGSRKSMLTFRSVSSAFSPIATAHIYCSTLETARIEVDALSV